MSGTSGPGGPGVSFAHSASAGGDGSACGVQSAAETGSEGLDDGLAEHSGFGAVVWRLWFRCVKGTNRIWFEMGVGTGEDVESREKRASFVIVE